MTINLQNIAGVDERPESVWKVRALVVGDRNPVQAALIRWSREHFKEYKAIMKVMRLAASQDRVRNPKHVKKSTNPKHGEVYEMIAYTGLARLMFFYDKRRAAIIICTKDFEKGAGNQDAAFARCAELRDLYLNETRTKAL